MIDLSESLTRTPDGGGRLHELAALGELSAVLAHELRNPLSSIKGAAQILLQEWGGQKPQSEFLTIILDEVDTLTALTTEFLDFARPLYPELTWSCWNATVEQAVKSVTALAGTACVEIGFEAEDNLPAVLLDRYQAERAVRQLLRNAIDATERGGRVVVRTHRTDKGVAAEIVDAGCGVPLEQLSRIFVPFFTTKLTATGLGLPVARKIAQNHGGDVYAHPNEGRGMTFIIHFPTCDDAP